MAEKRMFKKKIIDSDNFLEMPLSAQALYFHLNMRADDDGFIDNPKRITKWINASEDDLKILIAKRFVICFESGVIVIRHWRMHNTLQADRYHPTEYQEEFSRLRIQKNSPYTDCTEELPSLPEPSHVDNQENDSGKSGSRCAKEGSNGKKKDPVFIDFANGDEDLLKALEDFEKMRKETGSPMTARAKTMLLNKLRTFRREDWVKILEQSIFHDWKGIFPLKDTTQNSGGGKQNSGKGKSSASVMLDMINRGEFD